MTLKNLARQTSLVCVLALGLSACSGDDDNPDGGQSGEGGEASASGGQNGSGSSANASTGGSTSGSGGSGSEAAEETGRLKGITAAHNVVRKDASSSMDDLVWDPIIAAVAQAYAEKLADDGCDLNHSSGPYGENLYASWGSMRSSQDVVDSWASEEEDYNYASNSCSGVCGHYTQIVWANSKRLGCGLGLCGDGGEIWVCNYDPPGNYNSQKPY